MRIFLAALMISAVSSSWACLDLKDPRSSQDPKAPVPQCGGNLRVFQPVKYAETSEGVAYFSSIIRPEAHEPTRVFEIFDRRQRGPDGEMSNVLLVDYDCARQRRRVTWIRSHAGPMGTDGILGLNGEPDEWRDVSRDASSEALLGIVCK